MDNNNYIKQNIYHSLINQFGKKSPEQSSRTIKNYSDTITELEIDNEILKKDFEGLDNNINILKHENKQFKQENEKLLRQNKDLEDENILKNAKLLESGNLFSIPQVEVKNKEFQSFGPTTQVNNSDSCKNMELEIDNEEILKIDLEENNLMSEVEKLLAISQLDLLIHYQKSNDKILSGLQAARDEYLYKINCLKELHNTEILDLKIKLENNERSDKQNILKLRREKYEFAEEIIGLKKEIDFLNCQLGNTRESVESDEYNELEYVKQLKNEKHQLTEKQCEADKHLREIANLKTELKRLEAMINDQKCCQDRLECTLQSTQFAQNATKEQLRQAYVRIEELKLINNILNKQLIEVKQERHTFQNYAIAINQQRDTLSKKLKEKTKEISFLHSWLMDKEKEIQTLHLKLVDNVRKIANVLSCQSETENICDHLKLELSNIKADYELLESNTGSQQTENKKLQNDLDMVIQDNKILHSELEVSKKQAEDLKIQLQVYNLEMRPVKEWLEVKESGGGGILEQFKALNCEATQLESNNHSLESETISTKTLRREKEYIMMSNLERILIDKDCLITNYKSQMFDMTRKVVSLESQLTSGNDHIIKLEQDLNVCREMYLTEDSAKLNLNERLSHLENLHQKANEECSRLTGELSIVNVQLEKERSIASTLGSVLNDSIQECITLTINMHDLKKNGEDCEKKSKNLALLLDKTKNELVFCQYTIARMIRK